MKKIFITLFLFCFSVFVFASEHYERGVKYLKAQQIDKALKIFINEACNLDNIDKFACLAGDIELNQLSDTYGEPNYTQKEMEQYKNKFETYCQNGDMFACGYASKLGFYLLNYYNVGDKKTILSMSEKACNGNSGVGCLVYATIMKEENNDKQKTINAFNKACNLQQSLACTALGLDFVDKKDYENAFKYFKIACNRDANACYHLSTMYQEGKGVKKDLKQAKKYSKKACEQIDYYCH